MVLTVLLSLLAGLAFRKKLPRRRRAVLRRGGEPDHAVDHRLARHRPAVPAARRRRQGLLEALGATALLEDYGTALGLFTSGLGAHLTWTLPFGLLIMFAVFNRFNPAYEEAARDLGATPWQTFRHVVLPLIGPSLVGHRHVRLHAVAGTRSPARRRRSATLNTLPLELQGLTTTVTTPAIYALGTVTTVVSFAVMALTLTVVWLWRRRRG